MSFFNGQLCTELTTQTETSGGNGDTTNQPQSSNSLLSQSNQTKPGDDLTCDTTIQSQNSNSQLSQSDSDKLSDEVIDNTTNEKQYSSELNQSDRWKPSCDMTDASNTDEPGQQAAKTDLESEEGFGGPSFVPQLYLQRYTFVQRILEKHKVQSVVDFGSAECKIVSLLKNVDTVERIALVDIDGALLQKFQFQIKPQLYDYVDKRARPLTIQLFQGSATQLEQRIVGYEAVSMVEIIEHLYPDVLEGVKNMVFGELRPRLVVITTPNSEFNQLFPGFQGFRHWDHKFEWTRQEFQCWCDSVAGCYGYTVEYTGVGEGPQGTEHLGHCSQAAIFLRTSCEFRDSPPQGESCYNLIAESEFPYRQAENLSTREQLGREIDYNLAQFRYDQNYRDEEDRTMVPVAVLQSCKTVRALCDLDQLREHLKMHGYTFTEDKSAVIVSPDPSSDEDEELIPEAETLALGHCTDSGNHGYDRDVGSSGIDCSHRNAVTDLGVADGQFSDAESDDTTFNHKASWEITAKESWD